MRMSDQPSVMVETTIAGEVDRIFALIDDLEVMAGLGTEFQAGEWISGRPGALGSRFRGRQRLGDREWETISTVVAREEGRTFSWEVGDPDDLTATWTFSLRSTPEGTEVRYSFVHGPGPSGLRSMIEARPEREEELIDGRLATLQENMIKTLEGIRRRVES